MKIQVVIPARLASSRLPEKLLLRVDERSILQHTYEAARRAEGVAGVTVAVDDPRLAQEVDDFGGEALMTAVDCPSGTDRIAEVAALMPDVDIFVNVQGDEPEIEPAAIERVSRLLIEHPEADMATVAAPLRDLDRWQDPNCVKVVLDQHNHALYFSRAPLPHVRDGVTAADLAADPPQFWQHVGLYAYRREFLLWFATEPPAALERLEKLEQLRALAAGRRIVVGRIDTVAAGIDTLEDFEQFCQRFESQ
ncbi:3-deoxy-manno-octulosonate cytidylyltransferase [Roseimaritima sediminicola]|uniref:3-deoxy-manno-octulosonate cytidylyltransferase n=1 Tax=Roseimaritima sediminicola TaxID=2662066 RepID=UPI0012983062|nr:3-deoxy-manno-octulosonate cytidylyltransferase [Roseimaritima sediminicola]